LEETAKKILEDNVGFFCKVAPNEDLVEYISPIIENEKIVIVYDPCSQAYAELASWPLITSGAHVSLIDSHDALYYCVPYTSENTAYIYFTDNPEGQLGVQLESALRVMNYNHVILTWSETKSYGVFMFSGGINGKAILRGAKNIAYSFTKAIYRKNRNNRFSRVLNNILVDQVDLYNYINRATQNIDIGRSNIIASNGPLLSVAKLAVLLNHRIVTEPITSLLLPKTMTDNVEVWGLDVDSELIARVRFEKGVLGRIIHFGLDPLSSVLISPYAVAHSEIYGGITSNETKD
jgi:hypothetical protein